ncbi:MAG: energy transducer TonB [Chryseotalea sp.]|nr:energy transducer TonB [Cytophagales bacterium]
MDSTGQTSEEDEIIIIDPIEYVASFPGGSDSLRSFIKKNLNRPTKNNVKGKVFVSFIIDNTDGSTSDFKIVKGLTRECNKKAIEVLKKMPNWIPVTQNNIPIRQRFVVPVTFE